VKAKVQFSSGVDKWDAEQRSSSETRRLKNSAASIRRASGEEVWSDVQA